MSSRDLATRFNVGDDPRRRGETVGDHSYLIRYGVMRHVGRFSAPPVRDRSLERGELVVIQTDRGVELGEVLIALDGKSAPDRDGAGETTSGTGAEGSPHSGPVESSHVLRVAGPDDLSRSRCAEELRSTRLSLCQRILREENWPWELIDVEPLLDGRATVLHYLGPHQLDVASLRARFRVECDIDVLLEPAGSDPGTEFPAGDAHDDGPGGGCGSCDCSSGGGCGSASASPTASDQAHDEPAVSGCAPKSGSGCASCGISRMMAERNRGRA